MATKRLPVNRLFGPGNKTVELSDGFECQRSLGIFDRKEVISCPQQDDDSDQVYCCENSRLVFLTTMTTVGGGLNSIA